MQLKAHIKQIAVNKKISAQLVLQNYFLECLLERISKSKYKQNFIIKGGLLISNLVGLDTRTTMDLDATVKGMTVSKDKIEEIFKDICMFQDNNEIYFSFLRIEDIREKDCYPGLRVFLKANYLPISVSLYVDITTGDAITPKEIEYTYYSNYENKAIQIMAYNLQTILAEKIETILSRGEANTRQRDFYDIYILWKLYRNKCDINLLKEALLNTINKRKSIIILAKYEDIIKKLYNSNDLKKFWNKYMNEYEYAKNISFNEICYNIEEILNLIINI